MLHENHPQLESSHKEYWTLRTSGLLWAVQYWWWWRGRGIQIRVFYPTILIEECAAVHHINSNSRFGKSWSEVCYWQNLTLVNPQGCVAFSFKFLNEISVPATDSSGCKKKLEINPLVYHCWSGIRYFYLFSAIISKLSIVSISRLLQLRYHCIFLLLQFSLNIAVLYPVI